jgi:hypothetical protein
MTWDIEADVDIAPEGYGRLCRALVGFFADDLSSIEVEVTQGDWPVDKVAEQSFTGPDDIDALVAFMAAHGAPLHATHVRLVLERAGALDYRPEPEFHVFGDELEGDGNHRRRAPVVLGFGNRKAWLGEAALPSGLSLSDETLMLALQHVCKEARPGSLYVVSEEQVSIPFNEHFVFHADANTYLQDLTDIVQLCLYGGDGRYGDARDRYEPALQGDSTMMFGKRRGEHLEAVQRFLTAKLPRLEAHGLPRSITSSALESALLASEDLEFFFVDAGLGIFHAPLFRGYVEDFYFELIETLLASPIAVRPK